MKCLFIKDATFDEGICQAINTSVLSPNKAPKSLSCELDISHVFEMIDIKSDIICCGNPILDGEFIKT